MGTKFIVYIMIIILSVPELLLVSQFLFAYGVIFEKLFKQTMTITYFESLTHVIR